MANLPIKDKDGNDAWVKASGSGSLTDPYVPSHDTGTVAGAAAAVNSGPAGPGTQRVVLASDQPPVQVVIVQQAAAVPGPGIFFQQLPIFFS